MKKAQPTTHRAAHTIISRLLIVALSAVLLPPAPAAGQGATAASYEELLAATAARRQVGKVDQVREVLTMLGAGTHAVEAGAVTARLKRNWPQHEPGAPILVPAEVRAKLVTEGKDFEKMLSVVRPLLKFCWLENRVRPLLFRSEVPITLFIYPNALLVSTRALALLDEKELEAQAAHEVTHLIGQALYRQAVDAKDERTQRLVELFCDAGGAAIIASKGGDPRKLVSGLDKMAAALELEFQDYQRGTRHPPLKARKQLNEALHREFSQAGASARAGGH